jgi:signal transduction histidine kinase
MLFLFLFAILTGIGSYIYTRFLVGLLENEEREKVELWAEATRLVALADSSQNIELLSSIIGNNNTIPVILTDDNDSIISAVNFEGIRGKASDTSASAVSFENADLRAKTYLRRQLEKIKKQNNPINIDLGMGYSNHIYFKDSIILTQLTFYPYIQLAIIMLFILVAFLAFSSTRKAEYNQVWVGMSKETAHQLGTPTSSLAGWVEVLQHKYPDLSITREIALDVERLEKITERFSRIGYQPAMNTENIIPVLNATIDYLKSRTSSKIRFTLKYNRDLMVNIPVNRALFEWVIENVSKNAIDAMEGAGEIIYQLAENEKNVIIDISDTGKGIPKNAFKKIFTPGYTTKQRGWGLGLSLAKRIVEEFHSGRIYVRQSEIGKGSCIRMILNR